MKRSITLFFVFIFYYLQGNCIPQIIKEKNNSPKDISAFAKVMLKEFTPEDGLPQTSIMSIAVDKTGYLWIGTQDGAAYYNGRSWITINMPKKTGSNYVQTIFIAKDSAIWFSANRGQTHRYFAGQWESFDIPDGLARSIVNSIQETKNRKGEKVYWFGTSSGLSKYDEGKWIMFNTNNSELVSNIIYDLCVLTDGSLLIATNKGVSHYIDGTLKNFQLPEELQKNGINKIIQGKDGEIWFAGTGTIGCFAKKRWIIFHTNSTNKSSRIVAMYESSNGDLWIGSANGLMRITHKAENESDYTVENFFGGTDFEKQMGDIFCIQETKGGEMWFGTLLGLYRYLPGKWKTLNQQTGLTNTSIIYIYQTSSGDFLFGTTRGLFKYHNGIWKIFNDKSGLSNNFIKAILETKDGTLWVGTLGGGVDYFSKGKWRHFDQRNGLADNRVYSILQSTDGTLWFATARGVSKYYNGKWTTITTAEGLAGNQVMSLYQSRDGSLWFGTRSGLSRLYKGQFQTYNTSNGLCGNVVQSINGTTDGSIWFGTLSGGVSQFNPQSKTWKTYSDTTTPPLINNVIARVVEDRFGKLYFSTNKGITCLSPDEWISAKQQNNFTNAKKNPFNKNFSSEDGLPGNEGVVRAAMVDSKGRIWIGTTAGIAYFDPAKEIVDNSQKKILIEKVSIRNFSKVGKLNSGIELSYKNNNIEFVFALLSFFKESKTLYQTQLYPYETSPNEWSSNFRKEYTNLSDGKYIFRVWGKDYLGNRSDPAEFRFIISPPWWSTWWFNIIQLCLIIGFVLFAVKRYSAYKLKKQRQEYERSQMIAKERDRIARDMHDAVGASLSRIAILSDRVKSEYEEQNIAGIHPLEAENTADGNPTLREKHLKRITSIGSTARDVIDQMNEIIWSLTPKYDTLEGLVNYIRYTLNKLLDMNDIKYTLNISEELPEIHLTPDFRRNVFYIFKEAIANVFKHSGATHVEFTITVSEGELRMTIHDNGTGMLFKENGTIHFGLQNMKTRAKAIGANLVIETNEQGTAIRFFASLPIIPPI